MKNSTAKQRQKIQRFTRYQKAKDIAKVSPQGILSVVNSLLLAVMALTNILIFVALFKLYRKAPPTMVLDSFGHIDRAYYAPSDYRTPESMQRHVGSIAKMLFVWNNKILDPENATKIIKDPGRPVRFNFEGRAKTERMPTTVVLGSSAFSPDIQLGILYQISNMMPDGASRVIQGKVSSALNIRQITTPLPVFKGAAEHYIDLYSTLIIQDETNGKIMRQAYNKRFYLRPVPLVSHPLKDTVSLLEKTTETVRNGLEIYKVENLDKNLDENLK